MDTDELILVSVDDHVVEPPDMFDGHIPARYADRAPRVVTEEDGSNPRSPERLAETLEGVPDGEVRNINLARST